MVDAFQGAGFVRSPLNYTGGKFRLLPQIVPLFPNTETYGTFVDLFGGGANVVANIGSEASIYNDLDPHVCRFLEWLQVTEPADALTEVLNVVEEFGLSKTNEAGFYALRERFNQSETKPSPLFYALVAHSFNNQIRFNRFGEFNIPFGKNRSSFNDTLQSRFLAFAERVRLLNLQVLNGSFEHLTVPDNSFVYCDPPYLLSEATYNKPTGKSQGWGVEDEFRLFEFLRDLHARDIKWAVSNVMFHHGQRHDLLHEFASNFFVRELDYSYTNSSYHKKDRVSVSVEVLVTNYVPDLSRVPRFEQLSAFELA